MKKKQPGSKPPRGPFRLLVPDTPWYNGGGKRHIISGDGTLPLCGKPASGKPGPAVDSAWAVRSQGEPDLCKACTKALISTIIKKH